MLRWYSNGTVVEQQIEYGSDDVVMLIDPKAPRCVYICVQLGFVTLRFAVVYSLSSVFRLLLLLLEC